MSTNNAVISGLNLVNKSRQAQVEAEAVTLINSILTLNKSVAIRNDSIKAEQEALSKIANDAITQKSVLGAEYEGELNQNMVTIATAIKKLNDAKQENVSLSSQAHINRVLNHQKEIESLNKQINELREKLLKLSADAVTEQVVLG